MPNKVISYIHSGDHCDQPLRYSETPDGKFVLENVENDSRGNISDVKVISEKFDKITVHNTFDTGNASIMVEKNGKWGLYTYRFPKTPLLLEPVDNPISSKEWLENFKNASSTRNYSLLHKLRKAIYVQTKFYSKLGSYTSENGKTVELQNAGKSTVYKEELHPSQTFEKYDTQISVVNEDCLLTALKNKAENPVVLNMASWKNPGGGVENGAGAQEECLFRSSNYGASMMPLKRRFYPLELDFGGVYTPSVTVFRGLESEGYPLLDEPFITNFVAVPALSNPKLENGKYNDSEKKIMINKIRTIFNIAAEHNHKVLILGAFGCGAFHNPPVEVAKLFKAELESDVYKGRFEKVIFAIKSDHNDTQSNFNSFCDVFEA